MENSGREIVRAPGFSKFPWGDVVSGIAGLLSDPSIHTPFAAELAEFRQRLDGLAPLPTHTRHFPESDYTVHHRPAFSHDIRTWSNRTCVPLWMVGAWF
jgi:hypothetical protein